MIRSKPKRSGFTLVELMISAAITVIIMTILSICFQTSMSAMSAMRAQGDAADQLRAVGEVMKRDIKADHFQSAENSFQVNNGGRRLSDYDFRIFPGNTVGANANTGFVQITSPPSVKEGDDGSFDSTRGTGSIWMTSVLPGGSEGNLYTASTFIMVAGVVTPVVFSSEAAEVSYFLIPSGLTAGNPSTQLYNLYRRQRLVASSTTSQAQFQMAVGVDPFANEVLSVDPNTGFVNTMASIASTLPNPIRRPAIGPLGGPRYGDDIILSNVISFEVKPTWQSVGPTPGPRNFGFPTFTLAGSPDVWASPSNLTSTDAPYDTLSAFTPNGPYPGNRFDTLFLTPNHPHLRINAVQIRLRIYDPKVKTARQSSMVIEL